MKQLLPIAILGVSISLHSISIPARTQTVDSQTVTLGVCDVMRNLESYSGKTITVRGEVYFGLEITAIGDRQCSASFATSGRKWPNALWISGFPAANDDSIDRRPQQLLFTVLSRLTALYMRQRPITEPPHEVSAVFTGIMTALNKTSRGGGFGHLGAYPAELNVITVRDVTVMPKPAK
jgi:hypothetical protein